MTIYNHIEDVTSIRGATDKYQKYWQMFGNENYLSTSQLLTNNKDCDNFQILTNIEAWVNNIQLLTNIENLEWINDQWSLFDIEKTMYQSSQVTQLTQELTSLGGSGNLICIMAARPFWHS